MQTLLELLPRFATLGERAAIRWHNGFRTTVVTYGLFELYSRHDDWPKRGAARLSIGKPLEFAPGTSYEEAAAEVQRAVGLMRPKSSGTADADDYPPGSAC